MNYRVVYAPRSLRDLQEIHAYITAESKNQAVADQFLGRLFDVCETLSVLPTRYASYPHAKSWRMMPFGSYLVFFTISDDSVRVGHIRHGARRAFGG